MNYPDFFNDVEVIKVQDPLSNVLGAFEAGKYEFSYLEIVKSAGHSCPTVVGAYLMVREALKVLYPNEVAIRGDIKVAFKEDLEDGVAGVIANVVTQITGATDKSGFKGLAGKFVRHSLMSFNAEIDSSARFTRISTGKSVDIVYNPADIKPDAKMQPLMQKLMGGTAEPFEIETFGKLWQDRVKRIFENISSVITIKEV